jgi:hypothetical protein
VAQTEYEVIIGGASNGVVVRLGCKTLVFKTEELGDFLADLSEYLTGGYAAYQKLSAKYFDLETLDEAQPVREVNVTPTTTRR